MPSLDQNVLTEAGVSISILASGLLEQQGLLTYQRQDFAVLRQQWIRSCATRVILATPERSNVSLQAPELAPTANST